MGRALVLYNDTKIQKHLSHLLGLPDRSKLIAASAVLLKF